MKENSSNQTAIDLMVIPILSGNLRISMSWSRNYFGILPVEWETLLKELSEHYAKTNNEQRSHAVKLLWRFLKINGGDWPEAKDWVSMGFPDGTPGHSYCVALVSEARELIKELSNRPEIRAWEEQ